MAKLAGFSDGQLHDQIHEAIRALFRAQEGYQHALAQIEGQYLRKLEASCGGEGPLHDQVEAVRELYASPMPIELGGDEFRPRGFAPQA